MGLGVHGSSSSDLTLKNLYLTPLKVCPSLKSRHEVQKRGPPTPQVGVQKIFKLERIFLFWRKYSTKFFLAKHFHWWNIQCLPNGPHLDTHPGVGPLIRIFIELRVWHCNFVFYMVRAFQNNFYFENELFFFFKIFFQILDLKLPLIPLHTVNPYHESLP